MLFVHPIALAVPALAASESATAPAAALSSRTSGWTLDPRLSETPGQLTGCPNGQRNAEESECLAAVQEAAQGLHVRGIRVVSEGAEGAVPGGCSYSSPSQRAIFNTNPAGRSSSLYKLVCVNDGLQSSAAAEAAPQPSESDEGRQQPPLIPGGEQQAPALPCDAGPYVLDEAQYIREGIGSSLWPHSTSIIFADAIRASWIDKPLEVALMREDANIPGQEGMFPRKDKQEQSSVIYNSHDHVDYAFFLGFRHSSTCDHSSLMSHIQAGELQLVDATPDMYGDAAREDSTFGLTTSLQPSLLDLCSALAKNSTAPSSDPLLMLAGNSGASLTSTVFRFTTFGDHRFASAADCLFNPAFRLRYRTRRDLEANPGVQRPRDELRLSVHFRAGDLSENRRHFAKRGNGDLRGLATYLQSALAWLASKPEITKGLKPVVHLFSEGEIGYFKSFTDVLPGAIPQLPWNRLNSDALNPSRPTVTGPRTPQVRPCTSAATAQPWTISI